MQASGLPTKLELCTVTTQQKEELLASMEGLRCIIELRLYASGAYIPELIPSSTAI